MGPGFPELERLAPQLGKPDRSWLLLAVVFDPATARSAGRLQPLVTGWPVGVVRRLRRSRQAKISLCRRIV